MAGGRINQHLLDAVLADPYFRVSPPKNTGREFFNMDWLARQTIEGKPDFSRR
jgi:anhydro-N-acetylmuramic acid kinase